MTGGIGGARARRSARMQSVRPESARIMNRRPVAGAGAALIAAGMLGCGNPAGPLPADEGDRVQQQQSALSPVTMFGLLLDTHAAPVAGARIEVRPAGGGPVVGRDVSDAEGSFDFRVHSGLYDVRVTPRNGFAPQQFPAQVITENGSATLELVLADITPPANVPMTLRIVDQTGNPALAAVVCDPSGCRGVADDGTVQVIASSGPSTGLTVGGLWSFGMRLSVLPSALALPDQVKTIVAPAFNFSAQMVDTSGVPVAGAFVTFPICTTFGTADLTGQFCAGGLQADADARFHLTLPPGQLPMLLQGMGGSFQTIPVNADGDITITLPDEQSLSGRIVDRDGNGLGSQFICLVEGCLSHFCQPICVQTTGDGQYHLNIRGGDYQLTLTDLAGSAVGDYQLAGPVSLVESKELNITLPNRRLTGQVLDVDGTPAAGIPISTNSFATTVGDMAGSVRRINQVTDASGHFQFSLAARGDVQLTVGGPHPGYFNVSVVDDTDVQLQLSQPVATSGQLLDDSGQALAGQTVCYQRSPDSFCATTDGGGFYQLMLTPGQYQVSTAVVDGNFDVSTSFSQPAIVPADPATLVSVAMRPITGRVIDRDGAPIAGAELFVACSTLERADGQVRACSRSVPRTDDGGNFQMRYFRGLEPEWEIELPDATRTVVIDVSPYAIDDLTEVTLAVQSH
jgi:hypothetical protein